jgi:hypothetical protein
LNSIRHRSSLRDIVTCLNGQRCPARPLYASLMVLGENDQMTTPKNAQALVQQARDTGKQLQVVMIPEWASPDERVAERDLGGAEGLLGLTQ